MKVLKTVLLFLIMGFTGWGCSKPSLEEDARQAAELSRLSNEYAMNNDMAAAGKAYSEVQDIMRKYKDEGKFNEFYEFYNSYLQESAQREDSKIEQEAVASETE